VPESETKNEQNKDSDLEIIEQISTYNERYDTNTICNDANATEFFTSLSQNSPGTVNC
jgi:hypothetical protein